MKGKPLIFIFLFLIVLIQPVYAESHTGEVDLQLSLDAPDFQLGNGTEWGVGSISIYEFNYKGAADAGYPDTIVYRDATINKEAAYNWEDIPQNVGGSFALYDHGVFAGSGGLTIHRVNDVDVGRVDIWYQFDDTDFIMNESETSMQVTLYASPINEYYLQFSFEQSSLPYTTQNVEFRLKSGSYVGVHPEWDPEVGVVEYSYRGNFINEYDITLSGAIAQTNITRDGLGQSLSSSRLKLTTNTGSIVYLPSSYSTTNSSYGHDNGSYCYYLDVENYGDVLIYDMTGINDPSVAKINLNQTLYIEPELIQIDAELTTYDFVNHVYTVRLYGYTYGGWGALINIDYNESTKMENTTKSIIAVLDSFSYDLPIQIKAVLLDFNKLDYTTTEIAESAVVYYYPSIYSPQEGIINFNKTFYIDPEDIEVDWIIDDYDADRYIYEIQITTSVSGNFSQDSWGANGNWNVTPFISSASGTALFDFYSDGYDLPIWIQGELWAQDKVSMVWTIVDRTPGVGYLQGEIDAGSIWTDKLNYNVTELVEISYTTNVAENYIAVEEPYSLWDVHDVPVGTYSFMYELSTSAVGNTTIYLFENSELADLVTISVSSESGDDAYAAWMKDYYYEGETASFYYYSSNTSAQITVFDGADVVVFGPATTQLGYHNGMVNTANTNPGTFLVSLYHNGTYYNDTMIFKSADSWVRFDSSKYYVGDIINIEYYLADPTHQISMWDAHQGLIIRFTTHFGVLVSGSMETVPFTLSENNEYGYDVLGKLSSGDLALGYWTVFIEDGNGVLGDSWDEAYVCSATDDDDPADVSDDMISIFFSPEGVFMLFTVCLTMMGLVLAKHPAGGGAGATVGVGFGVYFKVLPVWMLMLTVILLVVMAGVSIAVYYKGK